uniref:Uncharacterized protein n=1 Tax=Ixodes ricinus TaxID=34613 RepID=A0A0K8RFJ4_IXORI
MHKNVRTGTDNRILNHSVLELPVGNVHEDKTISFWAPFQTLAGIVSVLELPLGCLRHDGTKTRTLSYKHETTPNDPQPTLVSSPRTLRADPTKL